MFSIIIPLYNKQESVTASVQSILDQTFQEFEIVVVNDGSTDASVERLKEIEDPRIRLIEQQNQGVSVARNTGIAHACNRYIAFLDADDLWHPDYLKCMSQSIECFPDYKWWGANYISTTGDDKIRENDSLSFEVRKEDINVVDFFESSLKRYTVHMTSFVAKREALMGSAQFPVGFKYYEDLEVFCRLALKSRLPLVPHVLSYWRQDGENRACNRRKVMPLPPIFDETIAMIIEGGRSPRSECAQCRFILELLLNEVALMCASGVKPKTARYYSTLGMKCQATRLRGIKAYVYCLMPPVFLRYLFALTRFVRKSLRAR